MRYKHICLISAARGALLAESVDWNQTLNYAGVALDTSRSPRGERGLKFSLIYRYVAKSIYGRSPRGERGLKCEEKNISQTELAVALLAESVDWNCLCCHSIKKERASLSSRRAWIEIQAIFAWRFFVAAVALLAESVDWNVVCDIATRVSYPRRSPHGERGLK